MFPFLFGLPALLGGLTGGAAAAAPALAASAAPALAAGTAAAAAPALAAAPAAAGAGLGALEAAAAAPALAAPLAGAAGAAPTAGLGALGSTPLAQGISIGSSLGGAPATGGAAGAMAPLGGAANMPLIDAATPLVGAPGAAPPAAPGAMAPIGPGAPPPSAVPPGGMEPIAPMPGAGPGGPPLPLPKPPMGGNVPLPTPRPGAPEAGGLGSLLGGMDPNMLMMATMGAGMLGGGGGAPSEGDGDRDHSRDRDDPRGDPKFPGRGYDPGSDGEWNYFPDQNYQFARGGLASMEDPGAEVRAAIAGQHDDPEMAIQRFLKQYGPDALEEIMNEPMVGEEEGEAGEFLEGPGDGMSDDIPATIEGQQPAELSDGEFVIPADVVSALGNGSSAAGAQVLQSLMAKVRMQKTGNPEQPPPMNPDEVMEEEMVIE